MYHSQISSLIQQVTLFFCWWFPSLGKKDFYFGIVSIIYFCFYFPCCRRPIQKNVTVADVRDITACDLFQDFYGFGSHIQVFNTFEFTFVYSVSRLSSFILLHVAIPVFPTSFIKGTVFFPLYILASFIKDKLARKSWIYFWALHSIH